MKLLTPESPHWPLLFQRAGEVENIDCQIRPHLAAMVQILERKRALGLAAPQVGLPLRFFLFRTSPRDPYVLAVNPIITWSSEDERTAEEGCLSFPGRSKFVERPESIRVEYLNSMGEERIRLLGGIEARVFQHELDHLNGVTLFPSNISPKRQSPLVPAMVGMMSASTTT